MWRRAGLGLAAALALAGGYAGYKRVDLPVRSTWHMGRAERMMESAENAPYGGQEGTRLLLNAREELNQALVASELRPNSIDRVHILKRLGIVHESLGDLQQAEESFLKALKIVVDHKGAGDEGAVDLARDLAHVYADRGLTADALGLLHASYEALMKAMAGKDTPTEHDYAYELASSTCNDIAHVYASIGDYEKAVEWYAGAIHLLEHNMTGKNAERASLLARLHSKVSVLLLSMHAIEGAEKHARQALHLASKHDDQRYRCSFHYNLALILMEKQAEPSEIKLQLTLALADAESKQLRRTIQEQLQKVDTPSK